VSPFVFGVHSYVSGIISYLYEVVLIHILTFLRHFALTGFLCRSIVVVFLLFCGLSAFLFIFILDLRAMSAFLSAPFVHISDTCSYSMSLEVKLCNFVQFISLLGFFLCPISVLFLYKCLSHHFGNLCMTLW